jgi:hypothetical protein
MALENIGGLSRETVAQQEEEAQKYIQELQDSSIKLRGLRDSSSKEHYHIYNRKFAACNTLLNHYQGIARVCKGILKTIDDDVPNQSP